MQDGNTSTIWAVFMFRNCFVWLIYSKLYDVCTVNVFFCIRWICCISIIYRPLLCFNSLLGLPKKFTTLERGPTPSRGTPMPQWSRATGFTNRYRSQRKDHEMCLMCRVCVGQMKDRWGIWPADNRNGKECARLNMQYRKYYYYYSLQITIHFGIGRHLHT